MTVHNMNDSAKRTNSRSLALAVIAVAQIMVVLDVTIVNVALPAIQADLHFSADGLQWVVNAYTLAFGGLLLLGGRVSDLLSEEGAQELLEMVPHARLVDVAGAGHMVAGDRNDLFNDAIVGFLERLK